LRAQEKRAWRRYIYLWINYALYEELEAKDAERTRAVYKEALRIVPHKARPLLMLLTWSYVSLFCCQSVWC
jgi:hypothetical protein